MKPLRGLEEYHALEKGRRDRLCLHMIIADPVKETLERICPR
jgi:hypothetical protein